MKKKWIVLLGTFVIIAFILQVIFYLSFIKRFLGHNGADSQKTVDFQWIMSTFLSVCSQYDAPVIPVHRETLQGFKNFGSDYVDKLMTTYHGDVFPFLTFNEVFDKKVIMSLTDSGFAHSVTLQPDAKLLSQNIIIQRVLHHIFTVNRFAIHVTVCYHRDGNFWWHGSFVFSEISPKLLQHFSSDKFYFAREEGAYNEFPITTVQKNSMTIYLPSNITKFLYQMDHTRYIECNHTRSTIFYSQNKMDVTNDAMAFRAIAWKILQLAKFVLEKLNVRFWLSSGTCLGYFRQCDIFPYSKDIDIGIWIKDYHPQIITGFLSAGMKLKHKLGKVEDSLELSFTLDGVKLDIFFFYEEVNHVWNGGLQVKSGKKFKYVFPKFNLCWTEFLGLKVSVPCQTESYIVANYGPRWFQPVMRWDWKTSPFNVHYNGIWSQEEWNEVIQLGET
ncbi:hypothetical protein CHUAL_009691 [Chamberlinius hualienensis]